MTDEDKAEQGRINNAKREKKSNQWIRRREAKEAKDIRERIRVGMICERLERAAEGKIDMTPTQVNAAKVLLDKTLPSLQAVEETRVSELPSEEAILASLAELAKADPGIKAKLLALLTGQPVPVDTSNTAQAAS